MKKSLKGKLSIIIILVATLFISAAIAVFGLSTGDITGATVSSASISAPENDASSSLTTGESSGGTITKPDNEATATTGMFTGWSQTNFNNAVSGSGSSLITLSSGNMISAGTYTVPSGINLTLQLNSGASVNMSDAAKFVVSTGATLSVNVAGNGSGSIVRVPSHDQTIEDSFFDNYGTLNLRDVSYGVITGPSWNFTLGWGAAVYNYGTLTMSSGSIGGLKSVNGGGAIYNNGTFNFNGGTISNCSTGGSGGGAIYNAASGTTKLNGGDIINCSTTGGGGGIVSTGGTVSILSGSSDIKNCSAKNGGGVYIAGGTFTMSSGNINNNSATQRGGGLHIADCTSATHSGGAIYSNTAEYGAGISVGKSLTINGSTAYVYDNTASASGGGIIVGSSGSLTVGTAYIFGNDAKNGGGINNDGTVTINSANAKIGIDPTQGKNGNKVTQNGGGIYNTATVNMSDGRVVSNTASNYGGGVYNASGTFNMTGGTIGEDGRRNSANYGGGIYLYNGTFKMGASASVSYNSATYGGGLYYYNGTFTYSGGPITNNEATDGGGVYITTGCTFTYSSSTGLQYNTATGNGGGVYNSGTFNFTSGRLYYNSAKNGGGVYNVSGHSFTMSNSATLHNNSATENGGGVYNNGSFTLSASSPYIGGMPGNLFGNDAKNGGGVYQAGGTFTFSGSTRIIGNTASANGGGVYISGGTLNMTAGWIAGNSAQNGGGVYYNAGTFTLNGGTIGGYDANKNSASLNGGGVYLNTSWTPTKGTISYNKADTSNRGGGGVAVAAGTFTLNTNNVIISDNTATGGYGGGVYAYGSSTFAMSAGYIRSNGATHGAGVAVTGSAKITLTGGTIGGSGYKNTASQYGGGVFLQSTGASTMTGGTISYNEAANGAGVCLYSGTFAHSGGTVSNNTASSNGGGVFVNSGTYTQSSNGYIYTNKAANGGGVYTNATYNKTGGHVGNESSSATGNTATENGGGIYVAGGTTTLSGSEVDINSAKYGAGVYLSSGTLNIKGGYIDGNKASADGGGVYQDGGTLNLSSGTIGLSSHHNTATCGGGIYVDGGSFKMTGGTIQYNDASDGGGIYFYMGTHTISGGSISRNTATNDGGGIYIAPPNGTVINLQGTASVTYNKAKNGAGVCVTGATYPAPASYTATLNFSSGSIYSNTATGNGGGVYVQGGYGMFNMTGGTIGGSSSSAANSATNGGGVYIAAGTASISAGTISYNSATASGAGLASNGTTTISGTAVINNNTASSSGGGISVYNGTLTINGDSVEIRNNVSNVTTAGYGGGMFVNGGTVNFSAGKIHSNNSTYGGGMFVNDGTVNMTGGVVGGVMTGNDAIRNGGGVMVNPNGTFNLSDGEISYNSANNSDPSGTSWGWGGGVGGSGTFTMTGGVITENNAATYGGGVGFYSTGNVSLEGGEIVGNTAMRGGGGVGCNACSVTIDGATVSDNTAPNGGGVYVMADGADFVLASGAITANVAPLNGGGVFVNAGTFTMTGGEISGNEVGDEGKAGGVYINGGTFAISGGSVTGNTAKTPYGAGVFVAADGTLQLGGTAYIYGNTYRENENNVYIEGEQTVTFSGKLQDGAKIGIFTISTDDLIVTDGFTTAGHTETDIATYFVADVRGMTVKYLNNEIVIRYDMVLAWNETVQASIDNNSTETFILYYDWTPDSDGSFGSGVGFYGSGVILVPEYASVIFDFNNLNIDRNGTSDSAMRVEGTIVFDTYYGGKITGGNAERGGAIYVAGGSATLKNGEFSDNTASYGGAVFVDNDGEFILDGGLIARNAAENGAGVYVNSGVFTLTSGKVGGAAADKNVATSYGGGVYAAAGGEIAIVGGAISYNTALSGAGVYVNGGSASMTDGSVGVNAATENGGGFYVDNGSVTLAGGRIHANTATNGAALFVNSGNATLSGATVIGNEAERGAGVYVAGGDFLVSDGEICNNSATEQGGGLYITGTSSQVTLSGGSVYSNGAKNGLGAFVNGGTLTVTGDAAISLHSTESGNGAGVYLANGTLNVTGGKIFANSAVNGAGVYVAGGDFRLSENGTLYANDAINGAGVYLAGGTFTMSGGKIGINVYANEATLGGGVYVADGAFTMRGGSIGYNLADSQATDGLGGGVYVVGGSFAMNGGKIEYNNAVNGAGVYLNGATVNMTGGEISNNNATFGGGIFVQDGTVNMTGGKISANRASLGGGGVDLAATAIFNMSDAAEISGNTASSGGGVYNYGEFVLTDGTISNNKATSNGGGLAIWADATFEMNGGEITANTAVNGGGIYSESALVISGGEISTNKAQNGAGIYLAADVTLAMSDGKITANVATGATTNYGGGLFIAAGAEATLSNLAEIISNTATLGGGVYAAGTLNLTAGKINENSASSGGGVYVEGGSVAMTGGEISLNVATDANQGAGGGGLFVLNGSLTVSGNSKINNNSSSRYGGAIRVEGSTDSSTVEITAGTVSENSAVIGGGVFVEGSFAQVTLADSVTVKANEASTSGGALAVYGGATAEVTGNAAVTENQASLNGGAVYVTDAGSKLNVSDKAALTSNEASYGGAVYVTARATFSLLKGTISYNAAENNGGAVYVSGAVFLVEDGEVFGNDAALNGGAVYVAANSASEFVMEGGLIGGANNAANVAKLGGGVYVAGGSVTLSAGEISGNNATENGGGVYFNAGMLSIEGNPKISGNKLQETDSNLYLYNGKTVTVIGKLTEGTLIGVTGTGKVTDGYDAQGNGDTEKEFFFGDVAGAVVVIQAGEIYLQISLEDAWNAAVQASLDKNGSAVTFVLAETWRADASGAFGDGAGVGFTDTGALYLPAGSYVILNLNGYTINRNLGTATAEGSVIYVKGKLDISGTTGYISGGNAENGGGVFVEENGALKLSVGYIQNNKATANGGGVYVSSGASFEMTEGAIRGNTAVNGGAVYIENGGEFEMSGGNIGGTGYVNRADMGGGVYSAGSFKLSGGYIRTNEATSSGGGLFVAGGEVLLSDGYIGGTAEAYGNAAEKGGAAFVENGKFTLDGTTISYNTATLGAGLYIKTKDATIESGVISNHTTDDEGAGVYLEGKLVMNGGEITANSAYDGAGAVDLVSGSTFTMNGGKIIGNASTGPASGGALYIFPDATFNFYDGIISGNTAEQNSGGAISTRGVVNMYGGEITANSAKTGGGVYLNNYEGLTDETKTAQFNIYDGKIYGNLVSGSQGGGILADAHTTVNMTGGEIYGHSFSGSGGGIYSRGATLNLSGGSIHDNNITTGSGGGITLAGASKLNLSGTAEISQNTAAVGGGLIITDNAGVFTMTGGKIIGNRATSMYGGGVMFASGSFTMSDGEITANVAPNGGGVHINNNNTFTLTGGLISSNFAEEDGGGVSVSSGATFIMSGGEISSNEAENGAGVYLNLSDGFILSGGKITGNTAHSLGGGVYVGNGVSFQVSGSPIISGNTAAGVENNVYLTENQVIIIAGMLSVNGMIAWIGVSMYDPRRFTTGFTTGNAGYSPALKPETVFFSDDTDYMVSLDADGEATLTTNDYSQTSLVWQLSKDGGSTWISIDAPEYALRYKQGETYAVRALDSNGDPVAFDWTTTGSDNHDFDPTSFSGIGSYKFVINSEDYTNPSLTFEIQPATLFWQYSTDEGRTWHDLTVNSLEYTGATYQIRACVFYTDYVLVESFDAVMKDVGDYQYTVTDSDLYENPTLKFTITTRSISVEWNFGDALGNEADGYYWEYDGKAHSPVAILSGVSEELAGVDLSYGYNWSVGGGFSAAQANAGTYTLTVSLKNADPNVELTNTTVTYEIKGVTLSLKWTDEEGNVGDEFEFEYDSQPHGVKFILDGVITGDTVEPYVTYATRSGRELSEAPTAVGYYTATVKLPANCYNYAFDKTYTCQIVITQKAISVQWTPNTDGTFNWSFNGLGRELKPTIVNPYTGEELNEAYKVEYAPVASNGNIGQYSTTAPVNAGNYIVRVTLNNADANYVLDADSATQLFTVKKLDVEVSWKGATYDADKDVYFWYYDGNEHDLEAEISLVGKAVHKDGVIISSLDIERTDAQVKLVSVGSATATIVLLNDAFNANFNITNSTSQVYEVRKAVITSVKWTDKFKQEFATGDEPKYDFGKIVGVNGPEFEATGNEVVSLVVTYSKTYDNEWVVDETVGYKAYAKLSAADAANYEFADKAEYISLTFFIESVGGFKTPIDVTWVVFINEHDYVALDQYLNDGGFVYDGSVQSPTPIYLKDNGDFEKLELNPNSIGKNAGNYVARLKPSSVYEIKEEDFTCAYEIKKLDINISWQDSQYDSNTTFTYTYNGSEQKPYAFVSGNYDFEINVTVKGKVNAGTYPATAQVDKNFNIVSGKTQVYTIEKKGLSVGLVEWDYTTAGASGDETNGWYWVYDGAEHAPTAKIPAANWGGDFDIELVITGKTSQIGKHNAYAVLNSSVASHNNFYLTGTISASFEIIQVQAGQVYWEDADGHTYVDGAAGDTGLVFVYNGNVDGQKPKAYYLNEDNEKVYLEVTVIGGTAVNAGTYSAYVSSDLDFASAIPTCTFKIKPMELTASWDTTTKLTFNGNEQSPALTLSAGADGYVLVEGVDFKVTGYTNAGKYKAELKFLNGNYTCAEADSTCDFEIGKIELTANDFAWDETDGYDATTNSFVWVYDGNEHYPVLNVTYAIDGVNVVFEIDYYGKTSTVGTHKVTAYVKSATLNGEDITDNFTLEAEMEYVIKAVSVSIEWDWTDAKTGTDPVSGATYYFWQYDGKKHAPKAYLIDADGNRITDDNGNDIELTVYGAETNARDTAYTATAVVPSEYDFTGDTTIKYFITKATIEVNWDFGSATVKTENGETYYEWTYGEEITPKAYIKNDDGSNGTELTVTGIETDAGTHTLTVMQSDGNYEFATAQDSSQKYVIKPKTVEVIWYGVGGIDGDDKTDFGFAFVDNSTPVAPTAYLAERDSNGDLQLIKDANGNPIPVEVSGAGTEIGDHKAEAVDTFLNYEFAQKFTQEFTIKANSLDSFEWKADGAEVSADGLTFTYEYSGENCLPQPSSGVEDLEFNTSIVKVKEDGTTETVLSITEVGTYKVTVTSRDGNYAVPDALKEITVEVTAKTVDVEWDEKELVYNGKNQMPKAYYTDVAGNKIELTVTVNGDSKNAGTPYTATATLNTTNYKLNLEQVTKSFEISQKVIAANWKWEDVPYDGKPHAALPQPTLSSTEIGGISGFTYVIKDKSGKVVAGTSEDDKKVVNAGEYTIYVTIEGPAAGNYKLDVDEYTFNINKKELTVKASDKEITYGNSLTLAIGDVTFTGLVADEEEALIAALTEKLSKWLNCNYTNKTVPGEYPIYVDGAWLKDNILTNYDVKAVDGKLTVTAAEGTLVWKTDKVNDDGDYAFVYDGKANLPQAYYYDANGTKQNLTVKYASYDAANGEYAVVSDPAFEAVEVGTYYAVIVDGDGNVIKAHGNYTFDNYGVKFVIEKREIVVTVNDLELTYGDLSSDDIEDKLGLDKGWTYGETKPVEGDDLEIKIKITATYDDGGYLVSGTYAITVEWNETAFGDKYEVVIEGAKQFIVEKADIEVNYDKQGETVYDAYGVAGGSGYISDFITDTKDFLTLAGYKDATVNALFKLVDDRNLPANDESQYGADVDPETAEGEYLYNFWIRVDNHNDLHGRLLVKVGLAEYILYVTVDNDKTFTQTYGYETADDLAKYLIENAYANYDESVNRNVDKATFLTWVTATVLDENGNEVSGRLGVGKYEVVFGLNETADERYSIYKASSRTVALEITKFVITLDWGDDANLNYVYDGNAHVPVITVAGLTDEQGNPVKLTVGENVITLNGEKVKVLVTVDGDFTAAGGHSVNVTVESENYAIDEESALRSISINAPAEQVAGGMDDWKKWVIIAAAILLAGIIIAIVIALVKRRKASDDDGFYDPVEESDLQ